MTPIKALAPINLDPVEVGDYVLLRACVVEIEDRTVVALPQPDKEAFFERFVTVDDECVVGHEEKPLKAGDTVESTLPSPYATATIIATYNDSLWLRFPDGSHSVFLAMGWRRVR